LALFSTVTVKEPTTYEEAINSEEKEDQIKWKSAIDKEFKKWRKEVFGRSFMKRIYQLIADVSRINGYLK
jgi:hypothetical protein